VSVNLWVHVTVSGHRPEREAAIRAFLDDTMKELESGWDIGEATSHLVERDGVLVPEIWVDTGMPIIISGAGAWESEFEQTVAAGVHAANGRACKVDVRVDDADMLAEMGRAPFRQPPPIP
jgi:hypothetical protein